MQSDALRPIVKPLSAAIPAIILFITFLSIPLTAAEQMGLSSPETRSWIFVIYGLSGALSLILSIAYRQPLLMTGNIFILIFVTSLGQDVPYTDLVGASIIAGVIVLILTGLGIVGRVAALIPSPIVFGLLAGAILPIIMRVFTSLDDAPLVVGSTFLAYIIGRYFLRNRLPATVPALIVGLIVIAITAQFGQVPDNVPLPIPTIITPSFSLSAIATTTPIFVVLITLQANIPSMIFMKTQGFDPPERNVHLLSGISTIAGSFLGPVGYSLALPLTSILASPEAGEKHLRHRAVYIAGLASIIISLLAGIAIILPDIVPLPYLLALAGLSLIDVLGNALQKITQGPLKLGPLFTFMIALSQMTFLGFGAFFWALLVGTAITFLLERDEVKQLNDAKGK